MTVNEYYSITRGFDDKGWVLVGVERNDSVCNVGGNHYLYKGKYESVYTRNFRYDKFIAYYAKFSSVNETMPKLAAMVGQTIAGNFRHGFSSKTDYNLYEGVAVIGKQLRLHLVNFKYKYDQARLVDSRISHMHHNHVRTKDVIKTPGVTGEVAYMCMQLDRLTDIASTHATFLTYVFALEDGIKDIFFGLLACYGKLDREWLKYEGMAAKQSQGTTAYDLSSIFELNVLINRVDDDIDWDKERSNRERSTTVDIAAHEVRRIAREAFLFGKMEGKKPLMLDWEQYWSQRAIAMPAGSVHSKYEHDKEILRKLPYGMKNKKGFASVHENVPQQFFLDREPEIEAHTSIKYEWGKVRALYGCDFTSHVNADFGLTMCEDTFPHFMPTGSSATEDAVRKTMVQMKSGIPFCYDYDDFNSQHSKESMKQVILAWLDVYLDCITDEQRLSVLWTAQSVEKQRVVREGGLEEYDADGTLFSGWRLTSFINTALNYVYLVKAGIKQNTLKSLHNGDDVFATLKNMAQGIALINAAESIGVRAQVTKMNIGTIAEFLRMDLRSQNPTGSQYLTRGVATMVHSRIESEAPLSLSALVQSYHTRAQEVIDRGGDFRFIRDVFRKQISFARRLFGSSKEITDALLETDIVAGGIKRGGEISDYALVEVQDTTSAEYEQGARLISNGVADYISYLHKTYPEIKTVISKEKATQNIMAMYNINKSKCTKQYRNGDRLRVARSIKGAWANNFDFRVARKVRMGVNNVLLAITNTALQYGEFLNRQSDPMEFLRIVL